VGFAVIALMSSPATAQEGGLPGATAASVLALGRQLSPELRAMALEHDAAAARADAAGRLDDPVFNAMFKMWMSIEQEFPLWGKLGLRRSAALAAVDAARGREHAAAAELEEKIKTAFARYYAASQALAINRDITRLASATAKLAKERYAQNVGSQSDAITAEAEITRTVMQTARLEAERRAAVARLNALLARPPAAPLAEPRELPRLPPAEPVLPALLDRARAGNPRLFTGAAEVRAAVSERELAAKAWYPDVTLGAAALHRDNGPPSYTATLAFKIPLQWGVKEAGEREAAAKLGAARQRLIQLEAEIGGDLEQALASLAASRRVADLTRRQLIPQLDVAHKAALARYRRDQGTLSAVFDAEHRIHQARLDLLRAENEAQTALAMIERLIGGGL
jgi:outer membrane protein TolC